jgi:SNF2 family DNA or RNA helicase
LQRFVFIEASLEISEKIGLKIPLYFTEISFENLHPEDTSEKLKEKCIKKIMPKFFPKIQEIHDIITEPKEFDPKIIYDAVLPENHSPMHEQPQGMIPKLRPYQLKLNVEDSSWRALFWMQNRENGNSFEGEHPLWKDLGNFSYNPYSGRISTEKWLKFRWKFRFQYVEQVKGGILADEMGLGKTLEVLSLVLANPNRNFSEISPVKDNAVTACQCGNDEMM